MTYRLSFFPKFVVHLSFGVIFTILLLLPLLAGNKTAPIWFFGFIWVPILIFIFINFLLNLNSLKISDQILYINSIKSLDIKLNSYMVHSRAGTHPQMDSFQNTRKLDPTIKVECSNIKKITKIIDKPLIDQLKKSLSIECILVNSSTNIVELEFKKPLEYEGGIGGTITPNLPLMQKLYFSVVNLDEFISDLQKNI